MFCGSKGRGKKYILQTFGKKCLEYVKLKYMSRGKMFIAKGGRFGLSTPQQEGL